MSTNNLQEAHSRFVAHIRQELVSRFCGKFMNRLIDNEPREKFFIGNLCTAAEDSVANDFDELKSKFRPSLMQVEFVIKESETQNASIKIIPRGAVWYRVFPTRQEQIRFMEENEKTQVGEILRTVYQKILFPTIPVSLRISEMITKGLDEEHELDITNGIITEINSCYEADSTRFRKISRQAQVFEPVPPEVLREDEDFSTFIDSLEGKDIPSVWNLRIYYCVRKGKPGEYLISVGMQNTAPNKDSHIYDNFIYESGLKISLIDTTFSEYVLDYLSRSYKYDGNIGFNATNCAVTQISPNEIDVDHAATFEQGRLKHMEYGFLNFDSIADNLSDSLKKAKDQMLVFLGEMERSFASFTFKNEMQRTSFEYDINQFKKEIGRFEKGINLITNDATARKAFILMNETFKRMAKKKNYGSWRLFQFVFIIINIPSIKASFNPKDSNGGELDIVDVIYFPTGGGKTEAYLGLVIYTLFYERFIGKKFGVSAITKFPLRLLSLQQLQRIANVLGQAELIRRDTNEIKDSAEFSLGFYVGEGNTPNSLSNNDLTNLTDNAQGKRDLLVIKECPFCDGQIDIVIDNAHGRVLHQCTKCKQNIPVYIVDEEIYRYLPSFIVTTLDKMAIMGLSDKFKALFGQVIRKCPTHGYCTDKAFCTHYGCTTKKEEFEQITSDKNLILPTIIIQDELHLVRESLGTFDSHYETFTQTYVEEISEGKRKLKVIGATATIQNIHNQILHLYDRQGMQYPSEGYRLDRDFYSFIEKDELARSIVGIMPHNFSLINALLEILKEYYRMVIHFYNQPQRLIELNIGLADLTEAKSLINHYYLMLSYHIRVKDAQQTISSIEGMVNETLHQTNDSLIRSISLTGDTPFPQVKEALKRLERISQQKDFELVVATSMISHGVDIDDMNFMTFMAMPRNTAEYVQAMSRVGRKYPALIFVIFQSSRERDQSYYKFFSKFHEHKNLLIEQVPINRWSKFSIERTFPGLFMASISQYFEPTKLGNSTLKWPDNTLLRRRGFDHAWSSNLMKNDDIIDFLNKAYRVDKHILGQSFRKYIKENVVSYVNEIRNNIHLEKTRDLLITRPMLSLRDVDEQLLVSCDATTNIVFDRIDSGISLFRDEENGPED